MKGVKIFVPLFWLTTITLTLVKSQQLTASALQYPELNVVPRATTIISRTAKTETQAPFSRFLWVQISSATSLTTALMTTNASTTGPNLKDEATAGIAISSGTLLLTLGLDFMYTPYRSSIKNISSIKTRGQRGELERQRYAEEVIREAAMLSKKVAWLSFLGNGGTAAAMLRCQARLRRHRQPTACYSGEQEIDEPRAYFLKK